MLTAEEYISKNFDIIPCEKNSKQPKGSNWQNQITKIENFSSDDNIGLHLINYIDIDIDNPVCKHFLEQIKSKSNLIYGRDSNPEAHILFKGNINYKKWTFHKEFENYFKKFEKKSTILELRSGKGKQSIVPGSTLNGEKVVWNKCGNPTSYDGDLERDLSLVVFASILSVIYPAQGSRDDFCFALACILAKWGKWDANKINQFLEKLAKVNKDDYLQRNNKGTHAYEQINKKQKIKGLKTLSEIVGVSIDAIKSVFKIIGISSNEEEPENKNTGLKMYDLKDYFNLNIPKPKFIVEKLLKENSINFISGPKGNGKTEFTLGLTHTIASGGSFMKFTVHEPRPVIYIDGEMDPYDIKERSINYTQKKFPNTYFFNIINFAHQKEQKIPDIKYEEGQKLIINSINEIKNKTGKNPVLVLDNLRSLSNYKENESDDWRPIGQWLIGLRAEEVATIVIDHHGKNSEGGPRGSSSKTDWANISLFINSIKKDRSPGKIKLRVSFDKARGLRPEEAEEFECEYDFRGGWNTVEMSQSREYDYICKQIHQMYKERDSKKTKFMEDLDYKLRMKEINTTTYELEIKKFELSNKLTQKMIADRVGISVGKINKIINENYKFWVARNPNE